MSGNQQTFPSPEGQPSRTVVPVPPQKLKLTDDELRVLRECNNESFYYRCLPLGTSLMITSQILVSRGVLKPHPRFGALFKNMGALLVGYIGGKYSYQGKCKEKILQLENSALADSIRGGKQQMPWGGQQQNVLTEDAQVPAKLKDDYSSNDYDSDSKPSKQTTGLDDSLRPSMDRMDESRRYSNDDQNAAKSYTSYDDLRQRNRIDYEHKMNISQTSPSQSQAPPGPMQPSRSPPRYQEPQKPVRRNQYGDVIEE